MNLINKIICKILGHNYRSKIDLKNRFNDHLHCDRCGKIFTFGNMSFKDYKSFKNNQNIN